MNCKPIESKTSLQKDTLVLLPGFLCDETVWRDQIEALSDRAHCLCMDWGPLDSLVSMAELVLRTAPQKFSLAGHSMGGRVAFEVYRMAPARVERLALMNTGAGARILGEAGEQEAKARRALFDIARTEGMRAAALKWLPPMMRPGRMEDTELVERIVQMIERKTPAIFEAQMNALINRPDANPVLGQIRCPTILLSGRQDGWSPPEAHKRMSAAIPGSRVAIIEDSGHMSTMEQPLAVSAVMREWMELSRGSASRL
jgi:pimeloyl-ACP methyl ester carboxylesterase